MNYQNFDIWIEMARNPAESREHRRYPITVRFSQYEKRHKVIYENKDTINIPLTQEDLDIWIDRIENGMYNLQETPLALDKSSISDQPISLPVMVEQSTHNLEQLIQQFGTILFDALFITPVYATYCVAHDTVQRAMQERLRIRLFIQPDELAVLPWELMYNPFTPGYLCFDRSVSLARCITPTQSVTSGRSMSSMETRLPLSVLGMVALSRRELNEIRTDPLNNEMQEVLGELSKKVEITYRRCQDWPSLQQETRGQRSLHVFHFLGHGGFDAEKKAGFITFTNSHGETNQTPANDLATLLHNQDLRLAVLNTCEGARGDASDKFSSTASTLARRGIPAVVAMQYKITSSASVRFSRAFYDELGSNGHIDSAVTEGRIALKEKSSSLEWVAPVLYLNSDNGKLFKINRLHTQIHRFRLSVAATVKRRPYLTAIVSLLLLVILITAGILSATVLRQPAPCNQIGLSTGTLCFDSTSRDAPEKQKAAQALADHSFSTALSMLKQAISEDPEDAEARIYKNDINITSSSYITCVIGVDFSSNFIGGSRDILQGALLAQDEWNGIHPDIPLVLLIANTGEPDQPATSQQELNIVNQMIALHSQNMLGIVGWEASEDTENIVHDLHNQLPIISPSSSTSELSAHGRSDFFRVVTTDDKQAQLAAKFAAGRLQRSSTVAILNTSGNLYSGGGSQTLESDFKNSLIENMLKLGKCSSSSQCLHIPDPIQYASNNTGSLQSAAKKALDEKATLIFFSGYAEDLQHLLPTIPSSKKITILGGDALSILNDYTQVPPDNVYFTAFASPIAWDTTTHQPAGVQMFFKDFNQTFGAQSSGASTTLESVHGADADTILGYDALQVLLQGYENALSRNGGKAIVTPAEVLQGLQQITAAHPYQGVSGQIAFDNPEDYTTPISKRIVLEHVVNGRQLQIVDTQGCLEVSDTHC